MNLQSGSKDFGTLVKFWAKSREFIVNILPLLYEQGVFLFRFFGQEKGETIRLVAFTWDTAVCVKCDVTDP